MLRDRQGSAFQHGYLFRKLSVSLLEGIHYPLPIFSVVAVMENLNLKQTEAKVSGFRFAGSKLCLAWILGLPVCDLQFFDEWVDSAPGASRTKKSSKDCILS